MSFNQLNNKSMSLKHIKEGVYDWFKQQEFRYPNRNREIHKSCCKDCPSARPNCPEEEAEDAEVKKFPKDIIAKEFLFVCAWRPNKLCKGFCDKMEINQETLNTIYNEKQ